MTETKISLDDFLLARGVDRLFLVGVGFPAGKEIEHNTEDDGEDFADLEEVISDLGIADLEGTVDSEGLWSWDGEGSPHDQNGNTIYKIQAVPMHD